MSDIHERLYQTKLILLAAVLVFVGLAFLVVDHMLSNAGSTHWLTALPLSGLGEALFTTGLVVVAFEYVAGRDEEERASARLRRILKSEAPAIRDAVIDGFAFNPEDLARVANPETLDRVITNSLALRLGDQDFASEIYRDVTTQVIRAAERWHDYEVQVQLTDTPPNSATKTPDLFTVTIRTDYTTIPVHSQRRFVCLSDKDEYRELATDLGQTSAWFLKPKPGIDAGSRDAFELVQFTVDGQERPIKRSVRKGQQTYTASIPDEVLHAEQPVRISYTYRTITERGGNLLHFDVEQPTRGISVELDYGSSSIEAVSVLDFFASSGRSRVQRTPTSVPGKSVSVAFDGWVFPRSGVAFVWSNTQARESTRSRSGI